MKNDLDLQSLISGEDMFSLSYSIEKRTELIYNVNGSSFHESETTIVVFSFGERALCMEDIEEHYCEDLSWLK